MLSHDTPQRCDMVDLYYALYGTKRPFCLAQQELSFLKPERVSPTFDRGYRELEHSHEVGHDSDLEWERERIREKDRLEREKEKERLEREKREKEREKEKEKERATEKELDSDRQLEFGVDVSFHFFNLSMNIFVHLEWQIYIPAFFFAFKVKTEVEFQEEVDLGPVFIDDIPPPSLKRKATSPIMLSREPEVMSADDNLELITVEVVAGDEAKVRVKVLYDCNYSKLSQQALSRK